MIDASITVRHAGTSDAEPLAELRPAAAGYAKLIPERSLDAGGANPFKLKRLYAREEFVGAGVGRP